MVHWLPPKSALQAAERAVHNPKCSGYGIDDGIPELRAALQDKASCAAFPNDAITNLFEEHEKNQKEASLNAAVGMMYDLRGGLVCPRNSSTPKSIARVLHIIIVGLHPPIRPAKKCRHTHFRALRSMSREFVQTFSACRRHQDGHSITLTYFSRVPGVGKYGIVVSD